MAGSRAAIKKQALLEKNKKLGKRLSVVMADIGIQNLDQLFKSEMKKTGDTDMLQGTAGYEQFIQKALREELEAKIISHKACVATLMDIDILLNENQLSESERAQNLLEKSVEILEKDIKKTLAATKESRDLELSSFRKKWEASIKSVNRDPVKYKVRLALSREKYPDKTHPIRVLCEQLFTHRVRSEAHLQELKDIDELNRLTLGNLILQKNIITHNTDEVVKCLAQQNAYTSQFTEAYDLNDIFENFISETAEESKALNDLLSASLARKPPACLEKAYQDLIDHHALTQNELREKQSAFHQRLKTALGKEEFPTEEIESLKEDLHACWRKNRAEIPRLRKALDQAKEASKPFMETTKAWNELDTLCRTQGIRNSNFMKAMPPEEQKKLEQAWDPILKKQLQIKEAYKRTQTMDAGELGAASKGLLENITALRADYTRYKEEYDHAEIARRKNSAVYLTLCEMINLIDQEINSGRFDEGGQQEEDWKKWQAKAIAHRKNYEELTFVPGYETDLTHISTKKEEFMRSHFTAARTDSLLAAQITALKLTAAQFNDLAGSHNLKKRSDRFFHRMHQLLTILKKFFNKEEKYAATLFAAPTATAIAKLEASLTHSYGYDLTLLSLKEAQTVDNLAGPVKAKAQRLNRPILIEKDKEFFIYGNKDGSWKTTKIERGKKNSVEVNLAALPFNKGVLKQDDTRFTGDLAKVLLAGHLPMKKAEMERPQPFKRKNS